MLSPYTGDARPNLLGFLQPFDHEGHFDWIAKMPAVQLKACSPDSCGCRDPSQKWQMMEACLHHLSLWLDASLMSAESTPASNASSAPAVSILLDLLGELQKDYTVLQILRRGSKQVFIHRLAEPE